ncbi:hypothetical protein IEQ34_005076 [Dendrobium chrysotoxum]|uniref:Uncharacterized protein n=1 Tax=Dendrobium chrysotoxum TaxID=161865 RepID=A0AAV7HBX4_DENCH|nr:hypothetical protein IEQ34_005076 [Dendrobium chrysotoxum]
MEKEVQNISERNKKLREELRKGEANQFDSELKLMKAAIDIIELKANLLDKETALTKHFGTERNLEFRTQQERQ